MNSNRTKSILADFRAHKQGAGEKERRKRSWDISVKEGFAQREREEKQRKLIDLWKGRVSLCVCDSLIEMVWLGMAAWNHMAEWFEIRTVHETEISGSKWWVKTGIVIKSSNRRVEKVEKWQMKRNLSESILSAVRVIKFNGTQMEREKGLSTENFLQVLNRQDNWLGLKKTDHPVFFILLLLFLIFYLSLNLYLNKMREKENERKKNLYFLFMFGKLKKKEK